MIHLILAGGSGTRLFPLSRKKKPKQFLKLFSDKTLIQETILRLDEDRFKVISGKKNYYKLKDNLKEIDRYSEENIELEPEGKNTAPAILFALRNIKDDEVVSVLPSDHHIKYKKKFNDCLKKAGNLAKKDKIVTIGINPQYPETGYGYIKKSEKINSKSFMVDSFKEKPDIKTAEKYYESNNYLWNAGMFIFKKSTFIKEIKKYDQQLYDFYKNIKSDGENIEKHYSKVKNISVDYAVMEKTDKMAVVEGSFGWSDIGSWQALKDLLSDDNENIIKNGNDYIIDSSNNLVISDKPFVSMINVEDMAVVDTKDVLMISDLKNSQKVKKVYKKIENEHPNTAEAHPDEERPWGQFASLMDKEDKGYKVKWIKVKPGEILSLQYHHKRAEHWMIVKGKAEMTLGEEKFEVKKGDYIHIPKEEKHTIEGIEETEFIEVQMGNYLKEDDIVRLEDKYDR